MYYLSLLNTKLAWKLQRKEGDKEMQQDIKQRFLACTEKRKFFTPVKLNINILLSTSKKS